MLFSKDEHPTVYWSLSFTNWRTWKASVIIQSRSKILRSSMQVYGVSTNVTPQSQSQECRCLGAEDIHHPTSSEALIFTLPLTFYLWTLQWTRWYPSLFGRAKSLPSLLIQMLISPGKALSQRYTYKWLGCSLNLRCFLHRFMNRIFDPQLQMPFWEMAETFESLAGGCGLLGIWLGRQDEAPRLSLVLRFQLTRWRNSYTTHSFMPWRLCPRRGPSLLEEVHRTKKAWCLLPKCMGPSKHGFSCLEGL